MADDDEIDILGDFSFNSCFAQNNQGIPSCSNREDTVHPQWLLDSTATNWYDNENKNRSKDGVTRKLSGNSLLNIRRNHETTWSEAERNLLTEEMAKYGRNIKMISQKIKTKSEAEIQALIEAEFGVQLETQIIGLDRIQDHDSTPMVVQEEIVTDDVPNIVNIVTNSAPTVTNLKKGGLHYTNYFTETINDDNLCTKSLESGLTNFDDIDISKNKNPKLKILKKMGNHRRKGNKMLNKKRSRSNDLLKSPLGRHRKDSSLSEDRLKTPKMQIVLGSGQALPLSEGEQVIKIEKKKDSEPDSDIEIDVDSGNEENEKLIDDNNSLENPVQVADNAPIVVPLKKLEPTRRRNKKINLDGTGGCTIVHTESGDLYEVIAEPRKERQPRKSSIHLYECRIYNAEKPAPWLVELYISALISMDGHAYTSRAEVMGLLGGHVTDPLICITVYSPCLAAASSTHCEMDPVSQLAAAERVAAADARVCGWHHSHPSARASPSARDLVTQRQLQLALRPALGIISSPLWATGRSASQYRCIYVEDEPASDLPVGYQLKIKLLPDLTLNNLSAFLPQLAEVLRHESETTKYSVDMMRHMCPKTGLTYLEKYISSIRHHMQSAGYTDDDVVTSSLIQGVRDVFR